MNTNENNYNSLPSTTNRWEGQPIFQDDRMQRGRDFLNSLPKTAHSTQPEETFEPYTDEVFERSESASLAAKNTGWYFLEEQNKYFIVCLKPTKKLTTIFSTCIINNFGVCSDGKLAAIAFNYNARQAIITFNRSELLSGKVFRKLAANGFPIIFEMSREVILCFENFIAQKLQGSSVCSFITKGFNKMDGPLWNFCYKDNYQYSSPFHNIDWNTAQIETKPEISLKSAYNAIKNYLCTLTTNICDQSFLLFLFAYLPMHPILKSYGYELDKTIHFIGNSSISENIMFYFLKVFNKGEKQKYLLSVTPSSMKTALKDFVNDIQPFWGSNNSSSWAKYTSQNYATLLTVNSDFNREPFSSIPMVCNLPLFQTNIDKAIIIDTEIYAESTCYSAMVPYFNCFTLAWVEFITNNQHIISDSLASVSNVTCSSDMNQTFKCVCKVAELLQGFMNTLGQGEASTLVENCINFLNLQNSYESSGSINEHLKKYFREFFETEKRYSSYTRCAAIDTEDLDDQIFYSEDYIAISSQTLSFIISPLTDCGIGKQQIMETLINRKLLYKPKESSYCSTAYLTNSSGRTEKKTLVQFNHALLDWMKLDINLFRTPSSK